MRSILLVLFLHLAPLAAVAQPIEFKGLPMGSTLEAFKALAESGSKLTCLAEDKNGLKTCFGSTGITYADQQILDISADFLDDKLASVTIQSHGGTADIIRQAISSKYGKVKATSKLRQTNPNGSLYDATLYEWKPSGGGRVSVQDHPRPHHKVYVSLESAEKLAWFNKVNTATPRAKKDI